MAMAMGVSCAGSFAVLRVRMCRGESEAGQVWKGEE